MTTWNKRYQMIQQLGKGGMGTVYLVRDAARDEQLMALKTIHPDLLSQSRLAQFKYEFAALEGLQHPNLVAVYDLGVIDDSSEYFYTMDYVPGEDLSELATRRAEPYDWLYDIIVQVCRALQYLHSRGFIHYDVKPSNIRITPEGQVKLLDLGLVGKARGEGRLEVRGTPEYIAPELVRGDPVDHRADLYSLGISLYEAVTGHVPFSGDSSTDILKQHLEATPKPLHHLPDALQTLITKLIAKGPAYRYSSANQVIQAINQLTGLDFPLETKETKRGYIQSGTLVGRQFELAYLEDLLANAKQGRGHLALIAGAVGVGKSRLARELRLRGQMQGILVYTGTCENQVCAPYSPWVSILSQLVPYFKSAKPESLQQYGPALIELMPELTEQLVIDRESDKQPQEKGDLFEATALFLSACEQPLVLFLEDLHHTDPETIDLLDYLGQRADQQPWLLLGAYRDAEIDENHPLSRLTRQATLILPHESDTPAPERPHSLLSLTPLARADAADFVKSMLGVRQPPEELLGRLMAETGGNVLFIESIMRSLVEEDLLQYDGQTWRVDATALPQLPLSILEATQRRLKRLDPESLDLLQWAAIAGQWLDMDALTQASGLTPERLFHLVAQATRRHVLTLSEQASQATYRFSTEQVRQAIYQTLSSRERPRRHRRIGEILRQLYPESERVEILAWHFEQAGDANLTLYYAKLAADKARLVYANESAIQHYNRALALIQERPDLVDLETRYELVSGRERCYALISEHAKQQTDLEEMTRLAQDMGDVSRQVEVVTRQVELAGVMGESAEAQHIAQAALDLARQVGDLKLQADGLIALGTVRRLLGEYSQAQSHFREALKLARQAQSAENIALSLYSLGVNAWHIGQTGLAQDFLRQALEAYHELGNQPRKATTLNALGITSSDAAQKLHYYQQALEIFQEMGDRKNTALIYNNMAVLYCGLGVYDEARARLEQAVQIQRGLQGRGNLVYILESLGRVCLELGEYAQAQQTLEKGRQLAIEIGNRRAEAQYWMALGRVALLRAQKEAKPRLISQGRELLQTAADIRRELQALNDLAVSLAWLGAAYLALGDWEAAHQCGAEAAAILEETDNDTGDYPAQDVWWLHYRVLKQAPDRLKSADWAARTNACLQRAYQTMIDTIVTLSDDDLRRSYLANVQINRDVMTEWTIRQLPILQAQAPTSEATTPSQTAPDPSLPLNQIEGRLKRVIQVSLQMNETHDLNVLLPYVMDQVIELSQAERGFLVLIDEAGEMDFQVARSMSQEEIERARAQISYTIIGTVAESKKPILLQDAVADDHYGSQDSVLALDLHSVLCVPLLSRSKLVGVIYVDNRSISGRFTQDDLHLMTIFANQAAISIENARLYEETMRANKELEEWAANLERHVAQRTAELQQANRSLTRLASQLETSSRIGHHITSILDLDELLTLMVNLIQARFSYYFVAVWLISPDKNSAVLQAGTGQAGETLIERGFAIPLDTPSLVTQVCQTGDYRLVEDVEVAPDYLPVKELPNARSELVLPLRMGEKIIGALEIVHDQPTTFERDDRVILQIMADQIAVAVRNAQLYQAEQARRRLAESLVKTGRVLSSSLDMRQVPSLILEQLAAVVPYERGSVMLQQDDQMEIIAQHGFPDEDRARELQVPIRKGDVFQQIVESRAPLVIDDVTQEAGWQQVEWLPLHRSWLGVPLISQDRVVGMVSLTRRAASAFSPDDATLVLAFASQAAIALENASLYDEITRFSQHLEELVQERTEALRAAYAKLERMDRTKSDFISIASHELRTPLTILRGCSQMLLEDPAMRENDYYQRLLSSILSGAIRMHDIVDCMLDVAAIDSRTLQLFTEPLSIHRLIEPLIADRFERPLKERQLTLEIEDLSVLPAIEVDPRALYKVFYHLIANAIKYTPDGGKITISGQPIAAGEHDFAQDGIQVVVSDTGIGIDPEYQELIFTKFYQTGQVSLHSTGKTKFKGGGPGLGLAIARGIVEAHGGKLWVESPGYNEEACPGSHFYMTLPLRQKSVEDEPSIM